MNALTRFSGILGAVLLLFGVLGALLLKSFTSVFLVWLHLLIGIVLLVIWCLSSGFKNVKGAGAALTGRTARFGSMATTYVIIFAGILFLLNVYAKWNDKRFDLTEEGVNSLAPRSVKTVQELKKNLKLVAIEGADADRSADPEVTRQLLERYQYENKDKVSLEFLDARKNFIEISEQLGMKPGNLVYVEYGDKGSPENGITRLNEVTEESVTNAILKLTHGEAKKMYYVIGHGEPALESEGQGGAKQFADAIIDEHLKIDSLNLLQKGKVPEDAAAVVLAAPKRPLQQSEKDALIAYTELGGRLVLLDEPENRDNHDIKDIADKFGIQVGNDVVIDQVQRLFAGPQLAVQFVAQEYGTSPVVSKLSKNEPPVFTFSSSVQQKSGTEGKDAKYEVLLKSGPTAWAESNVGLIFDSESPTASQDADDAKGPISIAVSYEKKLAPDADKKEGAEFEKVSRVAVFGDATWITNGNLELMSNRDLILNVLNWAVGQEGGAVIEARGYRTSRVSPIIQNDFMYILATSFMVPELILILGLFVWWRRRTA